MDTFKNYSIIQLKDILRKLNLSLSGNKAELIKRIMLEDPDGSKIKAIREERVERDDEEEILLEERDENRVNISSNEMISNDSFRREIELIRREKDLTDRENEFLRRQLESLRMTPSREEENTPNRVEKWKDLKDLIGEFSGNDLDYDCWEKQAKALLATHNLEEHKAKSLLCSRLSGKALKWYHSRVDCIELNCNDLFRELRKLYGQEVDTLALRRQLESRTWKTNETFTDYLHEKVILANRVPVTGKEMISYIIEGIPSQELRAQARVQGYKSTEDMLKAFSTLPAPRGTFNQPNTILKKEMYDDKSTGTIKTEIRCYNCNKTGHTAKECQLPKRERGSCFSCGDKGHTARQCPGKEEQDIHVDEVCHIEEEDS